MRKVVTLFQLRYQLLLLLCVYRQGPHIVEKLSVVLIMFMLIGSQYDKQMNVILYYVSVH